MDKTINEEITKGTLDEKKTFLVEFLRTKLLELGSKHASARNLGSEVTADKKAKKTVKFRRGDKVFNVVEVNCEEDNLDSDDDLAESLETILALKGDDVRQQGLNKRKSKLPQKSAH